MISIYKKLPYTQEAVTGSVTGWWLDVIGLCGLMQWHYQCPTLRFKEQSREERKKIRFFFLRCTQQVTSVMCYYPSHGESTNANCVVPDANFQEGMVTQSPRDRVPFPVAPPKLSFVSQLKFYPCRHTDCLEMSELDCTVRWPCVESKIEATNKGRLRVSRRGSDSSFVLWAHACLSFTF